jgi:hypothetical protein
MPSTPSPVARVLVAVDLSRETEVALGCAEELLATRPASIDVFYLWSDDPGPVDEAGDRAIAAVIAFARVAGAWDRLDRLSALEQRGILRVAGWLTRTVHGGSSLSGLAAREGYDVVVVGLEPRPQASHRFELHRLPAEGAREVSAAGP